MRGCACWRSRIHTVGRDTPEPIRSGKPCKSSHSAGGGQRTENPPASAVGSVKQNGKDTTKDKAESENTHSEIQADQTENQVKLNHSMDEWKQLISADRQDQSVDMKKEKVKENVK